MIDNEQAENVPIDVRDADLTAILRPNEASQSPFEYALQRLIENRNQAIEPIASFNQSIANNEASDSL
ncbi:hypothetical protein ACIBKY_54580 [Nonomuraea sp. NPDC050394]|uniref:hypothetical protein n=1 Tax=Nonomuraea sp. NPDC050394 TaxID=3364363 RepID=UPI0037A1C751